MRRRSCRGAGSTTAALAKLNPRVRTCVRRTGDRPALLAFPGLGPFLAPSACRDRDPSGSVAPGDATAAPPPASRKEIARVADAGERTETAFLAVVEALVERLDSVREFLQRYAGIGHRTALPAHALGRVDVLRLLAVAPLLQ